MASIYDGRFWFCGGFDGGFGFVVGLMDGLSFAEGFKFECGFLFLGLMVVLILQWWV